ncbi:MAG: hypothetical protein SPJ03_00505 [Candidatus Cryptobacteroides sp.]|nr:hypothetical protein [Candidatus Cryptobacteroides sp.]
MKKSYCYIDLQQPISIEEIPYAIDLLALFAYAKDSISQKRKSNAS